MDQADIPVPQADTESKAGDVKIEIETSSEPEGVPVEAPLAEQVSQAAKSMIDSVDPSYVAQLEKGVENLVSDPLAVLKNLGVANPAPTSGATEEAVLPTSDKNACESSEPATSVSERAIADPKDPEKADLDEDPRSTHTQPFVAVAAGQNASWMNCCGLLEVLRRSDN